jgi:hypothetical protein
MAVALAKVPRSLTLLVQNANVCRIYLSAQDANAKYVMVSASTGSAGHPLFVDGFEGAASELNCGCVPAAVYRHDALPNGRVVGVC